MKRFSLVLLALCTGAIALAQPHLTVKEFLRLSTSDTTSYAVTGVVEKVRSSTSGSFYLKDKTGTMLVYGLQDPANPGASFKQMDIEKGDTLTVLGRFTIYGGTTLEMKDGRLLAKSNGPDHDLPFYDRMERRPVFEGKEGRDAQKAFQAWVQSHVKPVPGAAGCVTVNFVVGRNGRVQEVQVTKSPSLALSAEVERVVKSSPKWKPGIYDGAPVRMPMTISVEF
jgi:hypothetical protein